MLAIVSASISFASIVVIAVAFARASPSPARRSRRRVVSSIRSASRVVASTPRASSRVSSRVVARRTFAVASPSRVVAVCRAPSSRRFAPRVVGATRRSVWFVWSYPMVRVRLGSIRGRRRSSTPFHRARVADDHGDAAPADEVVRARG
jgi:hypothetical protein